MAPFILVITLTSWIWVGVATTTHLVVTILVYRDSKTIIEPVLGLSPFLWAAISFTVPIGGMFMYWLMNYSNLTQKDS